MPHRIEVIEHRKYVRLTFLGVLSRADHETARADAAAALAQNAFSKLLIDTLLAEPKMTTGDDYEFTGEHQLHLPTDLRTAIVHPPDAAERFRFIENVAVNRGMNMKLFTEEHEALGWLLDS